MRLMHKGRLRVNVLLILVLLLALGLRLYRIEAQSFWNDEGTSVALAGRDLATIARNAVNDIHPPLYYYLLHFWLRLFGSSELAVRSLSALLGTLLVLLTFALGRLLAACVPLCGTGDGVGLFAALFAALSPFQVYYSQEARMYILSAFLGALSMYAFARLLSGWQEKLAVTDEARSSFQRLPLYVGYALSSILLLYTHYFAATVIIAQNIAFVCWILFTLCTRHGRGQRAQCGLCLVRWVTLEALITFSYLPWLLLAARQLRTWPAISEPLHLPQFALDLLRVFSLGLSVESRPNPVLAGFAVLLLSGIAAPLAAMRVDTQNQISISPRFMPYLISWLYLFGPVCTMYALSLRRPMYNPKFLLLCTPSFHILLAQGVGLLADVAGRIWQGSIAQRHILHARALMRLLLPLVVMASVVLPSLLSLRAYYFDPRYARDDYRAIAHYIEAVAREGDAILINAPGQIETFAYYYHGSLPLYPLPRQRPLDAAQTEADLRQVLSGRGRVFAVLWATGESDPGRFIEGWLDQHAYKAMDSWYGNVRLVVYAVPNEGLAGRIEYPVQVNLGNKVQLLGYSLPITEVMPGDILQLTLHWQAMAPMSERYKVFTHVLDAHGHLVGQRDAEPGGGAKITTIWQPGEQIIDNYGLLILHATPPGKYSIEIGMYGLNDGQRLPVLEGKRVIADRVLLRPVLVLPAAAPPPLSVLGMKRQLHVQFGDVVLLGYDLAKLGYEHQPDAPLRPGDVVHLTLFWQAQRHPQEDIALRLQLQDEKGTMRLEQLGRPTDGQYPTLQWNAGEIVRDQHNLPLPLDLPAGRYQVKLSVQCLPNGTALGSAIVLTHLNLK